MHINPGNLPEVLVEVMVKITCRCGCGRVEIVELEPELLDVGGVGIWVTKSLELAVGLHWGIFPPSFQEALRGVSDNEEEEEFILVFH